MALQSEAMDVERARGARMASPPIHRISSTPDREFPISWLIAIAVFTFLASAGLGLIR